MFGPTRHPISAVYPPPPHPMYPGPPRPPTSMLGMSTHPPIPMPQVVLSAPFIPAHNPVVPPTYSGMSVARNFLSSSGLAPATPVVTTNYSVPPQISSETPKTPVTTVFVGNICDKAPDNMIKHILMKCGQILNWKRVQGASGKLQGFGYCEYENPESTLRCIRLLNNYQIGDKRLLVKVDPKTNSLLEEYKNIKKSKISNSDSTDSKDNEISKENSPTNEKTQDEDSLDPEDAAQDEKVLSDITVIEKEFHMTIKTVDQDKSDKRDQKRGDRLEGPKHLTIDDMDLDRDRKDLINMEIEIFRNRHRDDEMNREDYQRSRDSKSTATGKNRSNRSRSPPEPRRREPSSESDEQTRKSSKRSSKSSDRRRTTKESSELDGLSQEEILARKRIEKKIQEKEAAYVERLEKWEIREKNRSKEYERHEEKERQRIAETKVEAQRLLYFFEKYDDDKNDPKYYKGSSLQRRQRLRKSEEQSDEIDRRQEEEELDILRQKLLQDDDPDAEAIILRAEQQMHSHLRHRLGLIDFDELPIRSDTENSPSSSADAPNEEVLNDSSNHLNTDNNYQITENILNQSNDQLNLSKSPEIDECDLENLPLVMDTEEPEIPQPQLQLIGGDDALPSQLVALAQSGDPEAKKTVVKAIIERIPTSREQLFQFPIQWMVVDKEFVRERIRPWVDKKINAYVGEDVPTLTDFICDQVADHKTPDSILQDIRMVLDDEAEVFVVKMWRLLIYIIEARTAGIE